MRFQCLGHIRMGKSKVDSKGIFGVWACSVIIYTHGSNSFQLALHFLNI